MAEDLDEMANAVRTAIQEDPTISDPTRILVSARKAGPLFRKETVIQLEGTVRNDVEARKAGELARRRAPNARIENNLKAE